MLLLQPGLAALALIPVPFVVFVAARYGRRSRPALQEVQQRIAEVTADVEENISGVRVVKAFAAEDRQLARFRTSVARVFGQSMFATRLAAFYNPFLGVPAEHRAGRDPAGGRAPGDQRDAVTGRLHGVLLLRADADLADADARRGARAGAAGDGLRRAAAGDPGPRAAHRLPGRRPAAAGRPRRRLAARRDVRLRRGRAVAARRVAGGRGREHGGARGRDGLRQDDARAAAAAAV